jgi:hypothetical protein
MLRYSARCGGAATLEASAGIAGRIIENSNAATRAAYSTRSFSSSTTGRI